jgi:hypothetical protein
MVWISINPDSEPESSVNIVAKKYGVSRNTGKVDPYSMACYYNFYLDPSVCNLSVSSRELCIEKAEELGGDITDPSHDFYSSYDELRITCDGYHERILQAAIAALKWQGYEDAAAKVQVIFEEEWEKIYEL